MRALALLSSLAFLAGTSTCAKDNAFPFLSPDQSPRSNPLFLLSKRQTSCPSNHKSCSNLGANGACCPNNTNCARDQAGNIACCPVNAVCTGVISGSPTSSVTSSSSNGGGGGIVLGTTTITSTAQQSTPTTLPSGYSTVPNPYYPNFIAIPQTLPNYAACTSAYTLCQSASTACYNSLAGQNGVTVSGVVGTQGVTQPGVTGTLGPTSASSVCSSLYQTGCFGIQSSQCGAASGTQTTGFLNVGSGAAPPRCTGQAYVAALGMGAGLVGAVGLL